MRRRWIRDSTTSTSLRHTHRRNTSCVSPRTSSSVLKIKCTGFNGSLTRSGRVREDGAVNSERSLDRSSRIVQRRCEDVLRCHRFAAPSPSHFPGMFLRDQAARWSCRPGPHRAAPALRATPGGPGPGSGKYKHVLLIQLLPCRARSQTGRIRCCVGACCQDAEPRGSSRCRIGWARHQKGYPERISCEDIQRLFRISRRC